MNMHFGRKEGLASGKRFTFFLLSLDSGNGLVEVVLYIDIGLFSRMVDIKCLFTT